MEKNQKFQILQICFEIFFGKTTHLVAHQNRLQSEGLAKTYLNVKGFYP